MIVTNLQPLGHIGRVATEAFSCRLADWLQRLEAATVLGSMNTNTVQGTMIDGNKDTDLTLFGAPAGNHVRPSHYSDPLIDCIRDKRYSRNKRGYLMSNKVVSHPKIERWSVNRKVEPVLEVIKGHKTIVDAAREHDLKQSDIQKWIETFMEYGRQGLKSNPKSMESLYEAELKAHKEKIGELVLQVDVLKKAKKILEESEDESSSSA
jgi:transposase-like protein